MPSILLIEDNAGDVELIRKRLADVRGPPYAFTTVDTLEAGIAACREHPWDVVLLDLNLPDSGGLETIDAFRAALREPPVVVLTGTSDLDTAVEALRRGADDYVAKDDLSGELLARTIRYAIERRRGVLENARLLAEAVRAARARENLLQVVSHDLRNHVGTMSFGLQVVRQSLPPESGRVLDRVERASRAMRRLLEDLVDIAAIEQGVLAVNPQFTSARDLLEDARALLAPSVESKGITLSWGTLDPAVAVWADRERVLQVMSNLVGNAVKFTPAGGRITVTATPGDLEIAIAVEDTGPGIPEADRGRIFDRFFRGSRPSGHGAGLGLAIARALVQAHRGIITLDSQLGRGTTFRFTLPRGGPSTSVEPLDEGAR
ncbi:MAG: ATP-binding protein [Myxococcota bacterium]|nr:ATP-binding protein [Myxococcota bacterium]